MGYESRAVAQGVERVVDDRISTLTEAQRIVLRLVWQGFESKDIARQLGVTHFAVNRRIERAIEILQLRNRKEAARALAQHEGAMCERIAWEPIPLAHPDESPDAGASAGNGRPGFPWPFATTDRSDGLDVPTCLFWALIGIPVIVMLAWGIFLSGIGALDTLRV